MMSTPAKPATEPTAAEPASYKDTLQLPQTTFPMRAGAATREVELQAFWEEQGIYKQVLAQRKASGAPRFLLHDGPPYLSSPSIHIGTALNKILKDIVVRFHTQAGYYAPLVPGYDGHGLPIEAAVEKQVKGGRKSLSALELRQRCRTFAMENLKGQEQHFKRLGVFGHWQTPYVTIDPHFEAKQVELFARMVEKGYVYKGLKPVHWCPASESALAEAEIEYEDHESHSLYLLFPLPNTHKAFGLGLSEATQQALANAHFMVWTTTPWTLPANVALAVHPQTTYVLVAHPQHGPCLMAKELVASVFSATGAEAPPTSGYLWEGPGAVLEGLEAQHPFLPRKAPVLVAPFVTTESGTGVVHLAGGHGPDDFAVIQQANRTFLKETPLPILSPIDSRGCFTQEDTVPAPLQGQFYEKANPLVLDMLSQQGRLVHASRFTHSYPHSWRSHAPIIFRATEQWFINVDAFRAEALEAIEGVQWIPQRGKNRIGSMVANRAEWCISRQRVWGVPIPAFYCKACGSMHLTPQTTAWVAELFRAESSDAWARYSADDMLQGRLSCTQCGHTQFTKEEDVMDVWFDSGVTHSAVVEARSDELGPLPVELYLEGSDQHRGWFQSSLLTSVMLNGNAPYKAVLTHGFVLDETGKKMSKSLGNVIDPNTVTQEYGADVLRLWVASVDYSVDVRIGKNALKQLGDIYRKIRNTARFLLGNLADFDPTTQLLPHSELNLLDRYVLHRLAVVAGHIEEAFRQYEFHKFYQLLQNLCVVELSSLYFDVVKDPLYCHAAHSPQRKGIQTVLYHCLSVLSRLIVPVLPHLAEDIWSHWPANQRPCFGLNAAPISVLLAPWPTATELAPWRMPTAEVDTLESLLALRDTVNGALEEARAAGELGGALEASVWLQPLQAAWATTLQHPQQAALLEGLLLVSQVGIVPATVSPEAFSREHPVLAEAEVEGEYRVWVSRAEGSKCGRCWQYSEAVGSFGDHPSLCHRCHEAVTA
jgi:isoleucyl-tRNA synthetase